MENDASGVSAPRPLRNFFVNNTCIVGGEVDMSVAGAYKGDQFHAGSCRYDPGSSVATQPIGNTFMTFSKQLNHLPCGAKNLSEWQSLGFDVGGRVLAMPSPEVIVQMARERLQL